MTDAIPTYIYWWFEADVQLVKIGHGKDPAGRMADYCRRWKLVPVTGSLSRHSLPIGIPPEEVERELHQFMSRSGHRKLPVGSVKTYGIANELFAMNGKTQGAIDVMLFDELQRILLPWIPIVDCASPPPAKEIAVDVVFSDTGYRVPSAKAGHFRCLSPSE